MGPVEDSAAVVYLRPETAQGIYVNFLNVQQSTRQKVPFGIAQIGKAFRNEITPGQLHLPHARVRADGDAVLRRAGHGHGVVRVLEGAAHGVAPGARPRAGAAAASTSTRRRSSRTTRAPRSTSSSTSAARSASRRSKACTTAATSTSTQHQEYLGQEARVLRPAEQQALPAVRRRDVGRRGPHDARRARERVPRGERSRARAKGAPCSASHPSLAPIKAGVFPLVKKDGMPEMARQASRTTCAQRFPVFYDDRRRDRPPLSPAGRGRHAVLHHGRRPDRRRTAPSRCATATRCKQERVAADRAARYHQRAASPG